MNNHTTSSQPEVRPALSLPCPHFIYHHTWLALLPGATYLQPFLDIPNSAPPHTQSCTHTARQRATITSGPDPRFPAAHFVFCSQCFILYTAARAIFLKMYITPSPSMPQIFPLLPIAPRIKETVLYPGPVSGSFLQSRLSYVLSGLEFLHTLVFPSAMLFPRSHPSGLSVNLSSLGTPSIISPHLLPRRCLPSAPILRPSLQHSDFSPTALSV